MMVLEFAILLGYDGQLEQNSDMEKELFASAINQLKERFISFISIFKSHIFFYLFFKSMSESYDMIHESLTSENQNVKARKCTCLALCENMG